MLTASSPERKRSVAKYQVVVNDEEQYSIWPQDRQLPAGWHLTGFSGDKEECLGHIQSAWTDMQPKSLRVILDTEKPENRALARASPPVRRAGEPSVSLQ